MSARLNDLRKRLGDERGETLVETLISILVSSLALMMLATAIGAAVNVITRSRSAMEDVYAAESGSIDDYRETHAGVDATLDSDVPLNATGDVEHVVVYHAEEDGNGEGIPENDQVYLYEWKAGGE